MIPQIIYLVIWLIGFFAVLLDKEDGTEVNIVASSISLAISFSLFAFGGFFLAWGIPQLIILAWGIYSFVWSLFRHGEYRTYDKFFVLVLSSVYVFILALGGFFIPMFGR